MKHLPRFSSVQFYFVSGPIGARTLARPSGHFSHLSAMHMEFCPKSQYNHTFSKSDMSDVEYQIRQVAALQALLNPYLFRRSISKKSEKSNEFSGMHNPDQQSDSYGARRLRAIGMRHALSRR